MTTSKDDLSKVCQALRRRKRRMDAERRSELRMYTISLILRFEAIQYAFDKISELAEPVPVVRPARSTTESVLYPADRPDLRTFYTNAFFSFAYSLFDLLANVMNVVHRGSAHESNVSFQKSANSENKQLPAELVERLKAVTKTHEFKRLRDFRNCCLHRREVCLREITTTSKTDTISYVDKGTTAIVKVERVFLLCDNPNAKDPEFKSQRLLLEECTAVSNFAREEIIAILETL